MFRYSSGCKVEIEEEELARARWGYRSSHKVVAWFMVWRLLQTIWIMKIHSVLTSHHGSTSIVEIKTWIDLKVAFFFVLFCRRKLIVSQTYPSLPLFASKQQPKPIISPNLHCFIHGYNVRNPELRSRGYLSFVHCEYPGSRTRGNPHHGATMHT